MISSMSRRYSQFIRFNRNLALASALAISTIACSNVSNGSDTQGSAGMFSFLFGKKKAPTTVNPAVGAALVQVDRVPALSASTGKLDTSCAKYRAEGVTPNVTFTRDDQAPHFDLAYLVNDAAGRVPLAIFHDKEADSFAFWELVGSASLTLSKKLPVTMYPQPTWSRPRPRVTNVACLPERRLLISVDYMDPGAKTGLFLYDIQKATLQLNTEVVGYRDNTLDPSNAVYFEVRTISQSEAIAFYATDRRRHSADVYYNYYNHFMYFSPKYPNGVELLELGIDLGNVRKWEIAGQFLYMEIDDPRNKQNSGHSKWMLDLSAIVTHGK
jgi:hypothetical protein